MPLMAVAISRGVGIGDFFFGVISPRIGSVELTGDPVAVDTLRFPDSDERPTSLSSFGGSGWL